MERPLFLFIESNTSGTGEIFFNKAFQLGFHPLLLSKNPTRFSYIGLSGWDEAHYVEVDTDQYRSLLNVCQALISQGKIIAGIFSSSEYYISTAAQLAKDLQLPGGDPEAIRLCRDKTWQRKALHGLPWNPRYTVATSVQQACKEAEEIGLPVVLKPTDGSGSIGVKLCETVDDVAEHAVRLLSDSKEILVEERVEGEEYSVEVFNGNVIGVTKKYLGEIPYFIEIGHDFPAKLSVEMEKRIQQVALEAVHALGLTWGPIHVELKTGKKVPKIMEVNPRLAGDMIPEIVRVATGIDLIEATIFLATGQFKGFRKKSENHSGIRFLLPEHSGVFIGIEGAPSNFPNNIKEYKIWVKPGDTLTFHGDFKDRIGYVIGVARTSRKLERLLENFLSEIKVMVNQ